MFSAARMRRGGSTQALDDVPAVRTRLLVVVRNADTTDGERERGVAESLHHAATRILDALFRRHAVVGEPIDARILIVGMLLHERIERLAAFRTLEDLVRERS